MSRPNVVEEPEWYIERITNCEYIRSGPYRRQWCYTVEWQPTLEPANNLGQYQHQIDMYHHIYPDRPIPRGYRPPPIFNPTDAEYRQAEGNAHREDLQAGENPPFTQADMQRLENEISQLRIELEQERVNAWEHVSQWKKGTENITTGTYLKQKIAAYFAKQGTVWAQKQIIAYIRNNTNFPDLAASVSRSIQGR